MKNVSLGLYVHIDYENSRIHDPGSSPNKYCHFVFLGKAFHSHSVSLLPGV